MSPEEANLFLVNRADREIDGITGIDEDDTTEDGIFWEGKKFPLTYA